MDDFKTRARNALLKHQQKQIRKHNRSHRKNAKPEQVLVKAVLEFAKNLGLHLHIVEAKAVYSQSAGRYLNSMTEAGMPDLIGNYEGLSVWIECKAPGRVSTLKEHQRLFLANKASQGCFACCIDNVKTLKERFNMWLSLPQAARSAYLLQFLEPKKKYADTDDLF